MSVRNGWASRCVKCDIHIPPYQGRDILTLGIDVCDQCASKIREYFVKMIKEIKDDEPIQP